MDQDTTPKKPRRRGGGGSKRMKELAAIAAVERDALVLEILAGLGRPATAIDRIAAESIAAASLRARDLRAQGRDDLEQQRMIAQLLRATGLKPDKKAPPAPPTMQELLDARNGVQSAGGIRSDRTVLFRAKFQTAKSGFASMICQRRRLRTCGLLVSTLATSNLMKGRSDHHRDIEHSRNAPT
jgi:hypothetical protein